MAKLTINWQRVVKGAETCERCGDTGQAVREAAGLLEPELAGLGVALELKEKELDLFAVEQSNMIFFNGEPLEKLLGAEVGMNHCQSCCDMLGQQTECRTVSLNGQTFEALPVELIVKAGRIAAQKLLAASQ